MENEFKLIKLSRNSWHYKLMKWFLGDNTPNPSNTFNFCRYFWILMFCLLIMVPIVAPFKLLFKLIGVIITGIGKHLEESFDRGFQRWYESLDRMSIFDVYYEGVYDVTPKKYRKNLYHSLRDDIIASWAKRELNLDWFDTTDKQKIKDELLKIKEEREALREERNKIRKEREEKERINAEKREKLINNINDKLSFIGKGWDALTSAIGKMFSFNATKMINIAKKTFGILLTVVFLIASYFIVNVMSWGLISLGSLIITYWAGILITIGVLLVLAILGFLVYLLVKWILYWLDNVVSEYKKGGSVWYIQVFYIAIIKPLYYLVYKPIFWIVMIPLNFIFYHFLWNLVVMRWIVPFSKWIWNGLIKFTGIFGVYFSASKGDYCPGIEWDEE